MKHHKVSDSNTTKDSTRKTKNGFISELKIELITRSLTEKTALIFTEYNVYTQLEHTQLHLWHQITVRIPEQSKMAELSESSKNDEKKSLK